MSTELIILHIIFGLVSGSFISALSYRIPNNIPIKTDRSRCARCNHILSAKDLIPLFSWIFQKGRCRYCKAKISVRYPLIELLTASAFYIVAINSTSLQLSIALCFIAFFLVLLSVIDLETGLLPTKIIYSMLPFAIAYKFLIAGNNGILYGAIGGIIAVSGGLLLNATYKKIKKKDGIGMGDIRFCIIVGMLLSLNQWPAFLFISGILGIATSILWRALKKGETFPFGPSIMISLFTCLLFKEKIINFAYFLH